MTTHTTGTREDDTARLELLQAEKEPHARSDELAQRRQELPWVRIDKAYRFETDEGNASLADLFRGRLQLLIYHFMFGPDYTAGRPSCSAIADGFNGSVVHLANHDVTLCAVSRAPLAKLQVYKQRMGWSFPWASSFGGDFNPDFGVRSTGSNSEKAPSTTTTDARKRGSCATAQDPSPRLRLDSNRRATYTRERPGMSAFAIEDGVIYHTFRPMRAGSTAWGHVPVARPRTEGTQRDRCLVAPPRRAQGPSDVVAIAAHCATGDHDV